MVETTGRLRILTQLQTDPDLLERAIAQATYTMWAEYNQAEQDAYADLERAMKVAEIRLGRAIVAALAEYRRTRGWFRWGRARTQANTTFERARAAAHAEHLQTKAAAKEMYDRAVAETFVRLFLGEAHDRGKR